MYGLWSGYVFVLINTPYIIIIKSGERLLINYS